MLGGCYYDSETPSLPHHSPPRNGVSPPKIYLFQKLIWPLCCSHFFRLLMLNGLERKFYGLIFIFL